MPKSDSWYWTAKEIFELNSPVDNIILFDDKNSLESIVEEPTIFLTNHVSRDDTVHVQLAIQRQLSRHLQDYRRFIRAVVKDDIGLEDGSLKGKIEHITMYPLMELAGAIVMKRVGSLNKKKNRASPIFAMASTLNNGSHVLACPMGCLSLDGRVDYVSDPKHRKLDDTHLRVIAQKAPNTHVQTIHYTVDPVYNKLLVRVGKRRRMQDIMHYDFAAEISKCTTITTLQLLSCYLKFRADPRATDNEIVREVSDIANSFEEKELFIFNPQNNFHDAITYLRAVQRQGRPPYRVKMGGWEKAIDNIDYQSNQIRHIPLSKIFKHVESEA